MKRSVFILVFLLAFTLVFASVPRILNYQGVLKNASGEPIEGTKNVNFMIYNVPTGGTPYWAETSSVEFKKGLFNVILGTYEPLTLPFDEQYYLSINIDGEELLPRIRLAAVPYSFNTENVRNGKIVNSAIDATAIGEITPSIGKFTELTLGVNTINQFSIDGTLANNSDESIPTEKAIKKYVDDLRAYVDEVKILAQSAVPIGCILPFGGTTIPEGWKLCNGDALNREDYPELYNVILTAFGAPNTSQFNVPDLRGRFIRGVNGSQTEDNGDPTYGDRIASKSGGYTGNNVGSFQQDTIQSHIHKIIGRTAAGSDANYVSAGSNGGYNSNLKTVDVGALETRPKNVYVNFIIKVKK